MISFVQFFVGRSKVEEPKYSVIPKQDLLSKYPNLDINDKSYEIRKYDQFVLASNPCTKDKPGFMPLAKYIGVVGKPQNKQEQKMAMTAPVFVENIK